MFLSVALMSGFLACQKSPAVSYDQIDFDSIPVAHLLQPIVNEISGIADSKSNPGFLWGHEDSGTPPQLYLIEKNGKIKKTIFLKGAQNRDWEDINLANNQIYIGDIGDNNSVHGTYYIYKFPEPTAALDTITAFDKISFQYPDGNHDAEAFWTDPSSGDIFIITKRDNPSKLYRLNHGYSVTEINRLEFITNLPFSGVVSAALSPNGNTLLVKTYFAISSFRKTSAQPVTDFFSSKPVSVAYRMEPQGEAITWSLDTTGFFTLSEKGFGTMVQLFFYPTKK